LFSDTAISQVVLRVKPPRATESSRGRTLVARQAGEVNQRPFRAQEARQPGPLMSIGGGGFVRSSRRLDCHTSAMEHEGPSP
jgi:hypothetical protein